MTLQLHDFQRNQTHILHSISWPFRTAPSAKGQPHLSPARGPVQASRIRQQAARDTHIAPLHSMYIHPAHTNHT